MHSGFVISFIVLLILTLDLVVEKKAIVFYRLIVRNNCIIESVTLLPVKVVCNKVVTRTG